MHPSVHRSAIYHSQDMEASSVPINRKIKKMQYIYIDVYTHLCIVTHFAVSRNQHSIVTQLYAKTINLKEGKKETSDYNKKETDSQIQRTN